MKSALLQWTPSASPGVQGQDVRIFNAESLEVYGESGLGAQAVSYTAQVPEGVVIQGSVSTVRGDESVTSISNAVEVGYGPLEPATGLTLSAGDVVIQPIAR